MPKKNGEKKKIREIKIYDEVSQDLMEFQGNDKDCQIKIKKTRKKVKFIDLFDEISGNVSEIYQQLRDVKSKMKRLHSAYLRDVKSNKPKKDNKDAKGGFVKPTRVPNKLADLLDIPRGTLLSRTDVTKRLYKYFKDNELQDDDDNRIIRPTREVRKAFGLSKKAIKITDVRDTDGITIYTLQTHIAKLYKNEKNKKVEDQEYPFSEESEPKKKHKGKRKKNEYV
jgi:chromatin remodeling complex protein RSC6